MNRFAKIVLQPEHRRAGIISLLDSIDHEIERGGDLESFRERVMDDGLTIAARVWSAISEAHAQSPEGKEFWAAANRGFGYVRE